MNEKDLIFGPRVPQDVWRKERKRFLLPTLFFVIAVILLFVSIFFPYWSLKLHAPQYPDGLTTELYINRVAGDIKEIDGLNHYIGMKPLEEAATLERTLSIFAIVGIILLILCAVYVHSPIALFLSVPAIFFPLFFLADLYFWMRNFGMNLDQRAPLSGSIKPFVPPLLGEGKIGQFKTVASWELGLYMSIAASVLIIIGLFYHRRAYKPLMNNRGI